MKAIDVLGDWTVSILFEKGDFCNLLRFQLQPQHPEDFEQTLDEFDDSFEYSYSYRIIVQSGKLRKERLFGSDSWISNDTFFYDQPAEQCILLPFATDKLSISVEWSLRITNTDEKIDNRVFFSNCILSDISAEVFSLQQYYNLTETEILKGAPFELQINASIDTLPGPTSVQTSGSELSRAIVIPGLGLYAESEKKIWIYNNKNFVQGDHQNIFSSLNNSVSASGGLTAFFHDIDEAKRMITVVDLRTLTVIVELEQSIDISAHGMFDERGRYFFYAPCLSEYQLYDLKEKRVVGSWHSDLFPSYFDFVEICLPSIWFTESREMIKLFCLQVDRPEVLNVKLPDNIKDGYTPVFNSESECVVWIEKLSEMRNAAITFNWQKINSSDGGQLLIQEENFNDILRLSEHQFLVSGNDNIHYVNIQNNKVSRLNVINSSTLSRIVEKTKTGFRIWFEGKADFLFFEFEPD